MHTKATSFRSERGLTAQRKVLPLPQGSLRFALGYIPSPLRGWKPVIKITFRGWNPVNKRTSRCRVSRARC